MKQTRPHAASIRSPPLEGAIAKLNHLAQLSSEDAGDILGCARGRERWTGGSDICAEAQRPTPRILASGWAARTRDLVDGRRQIFGFVLPGDLIGLRSRPMLGCAVTALTVVETIDVTPLRALAVERSGVAEACARSGDMDEALLFNHIVRLGRLTAAQRLAHIFLELGERLEMAGLGSCEHYRLPLTQEMLAEALGLSLVHMNRTIQQLRAAGSIRLRGGAVTIV